MSCQQSAIPRVQEYMGPGCRFCMILPKVLKQTYGIPRMYSTLPTHTFRIYPLELYELHDLDPGSGCPLRFLDIIRDLLMWMDVFAFLDSEGLMLFFCSYRGLSTYCPSQTALPSSARRPASSSSMLPAYLISSSFSI